MHGNPRIFQKRFSKKGGRTPDFVYRKNERRSRYGLENEERVRALLERTVDDGIFLGFRRTTKDGPEDQKGVDFVVQQKIGEVVVERAFGVTISQKSQRKSQLRHPTIPDFIILPQMKDTTIIAKIEKLFVDAV